MPVLFPYNKFTMSVRITPIPNLTLILAPQKLIKRTVFTDHVKLLNERSEALLDELQVSALFIMLTQLPILFRTKQRKASPAQRTSGSAV